MMDELEGVEPRTGREQAPVPRLRNVPDRHQQRLPVRQVKIADEVPLLRLDFSDEGDVEEQSATWAYDALKLTEAITMVAGQVRSGRIVRDGFRVVLAGPPNVGKSSLLNALSKSDAAIVSDEAGTTRDLKEIPLDINGQLVILIDSAGLRETTSKAEAIGVERAREAMRGADLVLWLQAPDVLAAPVPDLGWLSGEHPDGPSLLRVGTKSDLGAIPAHHAVSVSTGAGIDALLQKLFEYSGASLTNAADLLVSRERDHEALWTARLALADAVAHVNELELAAEDLRRASYALERLLGRLDVENVLNRLFSSFCIGK